MIKTIATELQTRVLVLGNAGLTLGPVGYTILNDLSLLNIENYLCQKES